MSEDLNSIREKLINITALIKELHETLMRIETAVDLEEQHENQTKSSK